jgi:glycosyltransferase involved in cell wall biosynthesis
VELDLFVRARPPAPPGLCDVITDGESDGPVPVRSPEAPAGIIAEALDDPAKARATAAASRAAALAPDGERHARLTLGAREGVLAAALRKDACAT